MTLAEQAAEIDPFWKSTALRVIAHLAATGRVFEAYDLTREGLPEPRTSSQWGALFYAAHSAGLIEPAGAGPSARQTVKGSLTRYWRGANPKRNVA